MDQDLSIKIAKAKQLLETVRHAAMATVNSDGSPHNTPFRFMYDPELLNIYWGSHLESLHSKNVLRTGQIYVVLYDAIERGGLYISGEQGHILEGDELIKALALHNQLRSQEGQEPLDLEYYSGSSPQKMWGARVTHLWFNSSQRDENRRLIKDERVEISATDLLDHSPELEPLQ